MLEMKPLHIVVGLVVLALVLIYFYGFSSKREGFSSSSNKFTMYYVDWCPHCQSAKPDFEALKNASPVDSSGAPIEVSMVNPEKSPEAVQGKPIKGYPTIILEKSSGDFVEYSGERNLSGYTSFLKANA